MHRQKQQTRLHPPHSLPLPPSHRASTGPRCCHGLACSQPRQDILAPPVISPCHYSRHATVADVVHLHRTIPFSNRLLTACHLPEGWLDGEGGEVVCIDNLPMLCPRQKHATKSLLVAKLLYRRTSSGDRKFKKSGGAKWLMQDFCISSISLGGGVGAGQSRLVRTLSFRKFPFFWDLYGKSCNNGQGGRARVFSRN